jgi:hypothetical protein
VYALSSNPGTTKNKTKQKEKGRKIFENWVLMAHACNPSNSGDRDQKDHGSKPTMTIVHKILSQKKKTNTKKDWQRGSNGRVQSPEFEFQYHQKRKIFEEIMA